MTETAEKQNQSWSGKTFKAIVTLWDASELMARAENSADQKKHKGSTHICQKNNTFRIPKTFWKTVCALTRQRLNFLQGLSYMCIKLIAFHKTNITPTVKHGAGP